MHEAALHNEPSARLPEARRPAAVTETHETKEAKWRDAMERKIRVAQGWVTVQKILGELNTLSEYPRGYDRDGKRDEIIERAYQTLLDLKSSEHTAHRVVQNILSAFEKGIHNYVMAQFVNSVSDTQFLRAEKKERGADLATPLETLPPEKYGNYLFQRRTQKTKLDGAVTATPRAGYILLKCSSKKDFVDFFVGDATGPAASADRKRAELAAGFYSPDFGFAMGNTRFVLVHEGSGSPDWQQQLLDHEHQHFINDTILSGFSTIETPAINKPGYPNLSELSGTRDGKKLMAAVKDEFLARLAESNSPINDCVDFMSHELYHSLLAPFSAKQKRQLGRLMQDAGDALQKLLPITTDRQLLVAMLIDVPLLNFPEWIDALYRYRTGLGLPKSVSPERMGNQTN